MLEAYINNKNNGEIHTPSHVAWTGDDLIVIKESAAWKIAVMSRQFPIHTHVALASLQTVDWTYVVKAATCHKVAGRCIRARHYPARSQWNCMYLQNSTTKSKTEDNLYQMGSVRWWPTCPIDHCAIYTAPRQVQATIVGCVDSNSIGSVCCTTCCTPCCTTNPQQIDRKLNQWNLSHSVRAMHVCHRHVAARGDVNTRLCAISLYYTCRPSVSHGKIFSPEFGTKFHRKVPLFLELPEFP